MTTEEKLKHFQEVTVENANAKSVRALEEYKKALETVFGTHKEDALRKQALQIKLSEENLRKEKNAELSKEQIEIKKALGKKQEELKSLLFQEVLDKLDAYMATSAYDDYLIKHIKAAKEFARNEVLEVYIDPADTDKKAALEEAASVPLIVSEYGFHGGMRAVIRSKKVLIDQSFETKLQEVKNEFSFNFD